MLISSPRRDSITASCGKCPSCYNGRVRIIHSKVKFLSRPLKPAYGHPLKRNPYLECGFPRGWHFPVLWYATRIQARDTADMRHIPARAGQVAWLDQLVQG